MPANPPENMPRITPYLLYEDVANALDWGWPRLLVSGSACDSRGLMGRSLTRRWN